MKAHSEKDPGHRCQQPFIFQTVPCHPTRGIDMGRDGTGNNFGWYKETGWFPYQYFWRLRKRIVQYTPRTIAHHMDSLVDWAKYQGVNSIPPPPMYSPLLRRRLRWKLNIPAMSMRSWNWMNSLYIFSIFITKVESTHGVHLSACLFPLGYASPHQTTHLA